MDIAVGSTNPVKVAAVRTALDGYATAVAAVGIDSGVSEQPFGRAETVEGARNRAHAARDATSAALGIGIEGGVTDLDDCSGLWLVMWAAATDGEETALGSGPALQLPEEVAARLRAGEELGPVMDDRLDTDGIAKREGAAGVLTDGIIDRESSLVHAVAGAVGPFVRE
ncbi:inosine/xanthosine triphosphatase [Haloarculaceae archaeon H-GB2-1]|nr:inosine/xanthosine triphosphatase [Haloarculaceae archaeon H-GB1-1]MEA5387694.1 inosine/xanthosine triphosphatase [Haloarculaceae archaeon H-GB11]MEA5409184.1 inosine/xanthosine triphosphatase [Haloarculaceae archaeon H-GB2-1]